MKKLSIGEKTKQARKYFSLSQKEFSKAIGIQAPYLSEIENNKKEPTSRVLTKLNEAFNISIDWLMFSNGELTGMEYNEKSFENTLTQIDEVDMNVILKEFPYYSIDKSLFFLNYSNKTLNEIKIKNIDLIKRKLYSLNSIFDISDKINSQESERENIIQYTHFYKKIELAKFTNKKLTTIMIILNQEDEIFELDEKIQNSLNKLKKDIYLNVE